MSKRIGFLVLLALLLGGALPRPATGANIALFNDGSFVDATASGEAARMRSALADSLGHTVTTFTGTSASGWEQAIAGQDALVIPELELGALFPALPAATVEVIRLYVERGGTLITNSSEFNTGPLLDGLFGFSLVPDGGAGGIQTLDASAAAGTPFAGGPPTLTFPSFTGAFTTASVAAIPGARSIYTIGAKTSVFTVRPTGLAEGGTVIHLGYDWFELPIPSDWIQVLERALQSGPIAQTPPLRLAVALYADSTMTDITRETPNFRASLERAGATVTEFDGFDGPGWTRALVDADVLAIPELERGDLAASLSPEAADALASFVLGGGGVVISSDANSPLRTVLLINSVLGTTLAGTPAFPSDSDLNAAAAAGTPFEGAPSAISAPSATVAIPTASLPAGSLSFYTSGANSTVFGLQLGFGRILWMGFDWFSLGSAALATPLRWEITAENALAWVLEAAPPVPSVGTPTPGADALVSVDMSGFSGPSTITTAGIFFREGGTSAFDTRPLVEGPPGTWTSLIPAAVVSSKGVQWSIAIGDGSNTAAIPFGANSSRWLSLPVRLADFPVASLPAESYRLLGMRVQPDNTNPEGIFGGLGEYGTRWRYGTFTPGSGTYAEPPSARPATPGQGFWAISRSAADVLANARSSDLSRPLAITLREGFNQIANPFDFPVDFADVVLDADVESNLIGFDGSGYVNGTSVLQPGQGYWIRNNGPGDRTILIPPLGSGVAPAAQPVEPVRIATPGALARGESGWSVRVDAQAAGFVDRDNRFGVRAGATVGLDAFDFSDAPAAPEDWIALGFEGPEGRALLADWRPEGGDGATWRMIVRSDRAGSAWRADASVEGTLPAGWSVVAIEEGTGREVDLLATPALGGTVGGTGWESVWTLAAGDEDWIARVRTELGGSIAAFALGAPFPNPSAHGVAVDLAVPRRVDAAVQVFDVAGRLVRTLANGPLEAGAHRIAWDGRSAEGTPVPAGVYFVKTRAAEFSSSRKVVLIR